MIKLLMIVILLSITSCYNINSGTAFDGTPTKSYVTINNHNQYDASQFDMYINSQIIRLNDLNIYSLSNTGLLFSDFYNIEKSAKGAFWSNISKKIIFTEVEMELTNSLKAIGYYKSTEFNPQINISIGYGDGKVGDQGMLVAKHLHISCTKTSKDIANNYPIWKISTHLVSNEVNIRNIIIPMIKCASPYLNKNFKGTITCKR